MFRPDQLFAFANGSYGGTPETTTTTVDTPYGPVVGTFTQKKTSIEVYTTCPKPGTSGRHFRNSLSESILEEKANRVCHVRALDGAKRISLTYPNDIWLKGFIQAIDPRSDEAWDKLRHDIKNDRTQGCDVRQECANGTIPIAISYKWQGDQVGLRMSDVQFNNLRNMVCHHLSTLDGAKITFWLDQHMRKHVGDRERNHWLSYGTTAYRNSIVCYLPNVDITGPSPDPRIKIGDKPIDISDAFLSDTSRLWIAFEIRRATQGVGLICGKGTELGVSKNVILDGPKTMMDMWTNGFVVGGDLTDNEARLQEDGDIRSGRLLGVNESWDDFLLEERARLSSPVSSEVMEIKRYKHYAGGENGGNCYSFCPGGRYESENGIPRISICDVSPGQHCTSSYVSVRSMKRGESWNRGALLLAGDFEDTDKANEVSEVPMRRIATSCDPNSRKTLELWIAHVSTKHAEKYCCVVVESFPKIAAVLELIDVWPINSHIFDAAMMGLWTGIAGVVAYLGELEVTSQDWSSYTLHTKDRAVLAPELQGFLRIELTMLGYLLARAEGLPLV